MKSLQELSQREQEEIQLVREKYQRLRRMVPHVCEREDDVIDIDARTIYEMNHCKHCGADMAAKGQA